MKTLLDLQKDFGARAIELHTGVAGLRAGIKCEAKAVAGDEFSIDMVATDETVDRYNEKILLSSWDTRNYLANPVVVDSHDYSSVMRILGRSSSLTIAEGKMTNRVSFAMDNPFGAMAYKMTKAGFIKSQSVGFIPLEYKPGGVGGPDRIYTKAELLEISLVAIPANPGATIGLALKSGAIERSDVTALRAFLEDFCGEKKAGTPADPERMGRSADDAQRLQMLRALSNVLGAS